MHRIGIDVGSTYTKYCVMRDDEIVTLFSEKTPIRQKDFFTEKVKKLKERYPGSEIVSCGYGKSNVTGMNTVNELTALAKGVYYITGEDGIVLDIGGQDTKVIRQEHGQLKEFFINDKCAAGSGMFLTSVLDMIDFKFEDIDLNKPVERTVCLSSTCAVFAQSEIVEMIADNCTEEEIVSSVIQQIIIKAKPLLSKVNDGPILLSGGLSRIKGIEAIVSGIIGRECSVVSNGTYLAAVGCVL